MPPEASDAPPPGLLGLKKLRHTLLRTKLLRRVRYAFFQTAFSMVAHEPGRNPRPQRLRSVSTRQRTLQLMALLTGLFLTLTYESVSHGILLPPIVLRNRDHRVVRSMAGR